MNEAGRGNVTYTLRSFAGPPIGGCRLQTANRVSFTCKEILSAVGNGGNVGAGGRDKKELSCITFMRGMRMKLSLSY